MNEAPEAPTKTDNEPVGPRAEEGEGQPKSAETAGPASIANGLPPSEAAARMAVFYASLRRATPSIWATPLVLGVNVVVFVVMLVSGVDIMTPLTKDLLTWGANYGANTTGGEPWRLFTCMFLHIGVIHILFNMMVLWNVGPLIERLLGNFGFLVAYVVSGLAGSLASSAWNPYIVSAGASGAIFGLYGVLIGFLLRHKEGIPKEVLLGLQKDAVVFVGYNLVYGFMLPNTDVAAHLGGLLGGFLCGLLVAHPPSREAVSKRPLRNLALAAGGGVVLTLAFLTLPKTADLQGAIEKFSAMETRVLDEYSKIITKAKGGEADDEEVARLIEQDVLPPWKDGQSLFSKMDDLPKKQRAMVDALMAYADARREGWELMAKAARSDDPELAAKAQARQNEAEALIKKIDEAAN